MALLETRNNASVQAVKYLTFHLADEEYGFPVLSVQEIIQWTEVTRVPRLPEFVSGLILITIFAIELGWFPSQSNIAPDSTFTEALPYLILPGITVALTSLAYVVRMTRSSTVDVLQMDYVRTANLKGLPPRKVLFTHVLRNSLLPTITVVAISIGWLIGGLIVTEAVYGYPGIGRLLLFADAPLHAGEQERLGV